MRCITLLPVGSPAVPYFSILPHNRHFFGKKSLNIKRVFRFCQQHLPETFPILRIIQRDAIINVHMSSYQLFLSDFNENLNFLDRFSKNTQISNFVKMHPQRADMFHVGGRGWTETDRQIDTTKQIVAFCILVNAPESENF